MKNRKNKNYVILERKIFKQFCIIVLIAIASIAGLMVLVRGIFGDLVVYILRIAFGFNTDDAVYFYQQVIRNNIYILALVAIVIALLIMFRILVSWMTKHFDEIDQGMDILMDQNNTEISLSSEMLFLETKLNKCKDILNKRQQEAAIAEQKKNDLVVYLAHDIKTPLTSVIGYLELMNEIPEMPLEQRAKYINITLDKAYRLEQLINEFFEITRFNLNTIVLNKSTINLSFMLQQIVDEFYPMLQHKNNTITLTSSDDVTIYGDSDKLSRVFNNIIKNAISYSYQDSDIQVLVMQKDTCVSISICNSGNPIPKHNLQTIFEKFYRLDSSRSTKTGGSGLGLAIAKEIMEAHNGDILVQSTKEITIFEILIPA